MQGKHVVYLWILHCTCVNHIQRSASRCTLLCRLEEELNGPGKGLTVLRQHFRYSQQYRCVAIVSAGVHLALVTRGKG